jgi:hypothetical protein
MAKEKRKKKKKMKTLIHQCLWVMREWCRKSNLRCIYIFGKTSFIIFNFFIIFIFIIIFLNFKKCQLIYRFFNFKSWHDLHVKVEGSTKHLKTLHHFSCFLSHAALVHFTLKLKFDILNLCTITSLSFLLLFLYLLLNFLFAPHKKRRSLE